MLAGRNGSGRTTLLRAMAPALRVAWNRPLIDVLVAMFHQSGHPAADALFAGEEELLDLPRNSELRTAFLHFRGVSY
ncbi:hypothetical protein ABT404_29445 [Streptomyces hyaluromycini]|uniref:Uncharacterized protein n=1 Tax=Streptomyces hyaluromycini TaxID=1377993 RepID=A0ABV1X3G2_9ACTN